MLRKTKSRRRERQSRRRLYNITNSVHMSLSKPQDTVKDREAGVLQSTGSPRGRHTT